MITTSQSKAIFSAACLLLSGTSASNMNFKYHTLGENWHENHSICGSGMEQSPINLSQYLAKKVNATQFDLNGEGYMNYDKNVLHYKQNTVQVNIDDGVFWAVLPDGVRHEFKPAQIHFHSPSEHTMNGRYYDLEMHFVHVDHTQEGSYGVLGFFFDREKGGNYQNSFIDELDVLSQIYVEDPGFSALQRLESLDVANFLNNIDFSKYYFYEGSLTTPPCSEGVNWFVVDEVQPISDEQFEKFNNRWADNDYFAHGNGNNRKTQPLGNRTLYLVQE